MRRLLLIIVVAAPPSAARAQAPSVPGAHVTARGEVAAGGRLDVGQRGLALPATVEVRSAAGHWHAVGKPIAGDERVRVHAPGRPRSLRVRARGADGVLTPARRVRVRYLSLAAVGDVNLGDGPGTQIAVHGVRYPWTSVRRALRPADLAFGNLECAVSTRGSAVAKEFTFRGRPSALRAAARYGGLDVVNLANNHAGDYGDTALVDTLRHAHEDGLATVGAGVDAGRAYRPRIVRRLGLRVAFVGFSEILPFEFRAGPHDPGTAWAFPDRVRASVRRARRRADVVIATFHWGIERDFRENAGQRALAHLALRSGATAVIAAHPHVLQPIVRTRRHVIAYSLGNFVFSASTPGTEATGILHLRLAAHRVASSHFQRATISNSRPVLAPHLPN